MHPFEIRPVSTGVMPYDWYAVYTRHQHERSASQTLINRGFEVLLPLYRSVSHWKDRRKIIHRPLFSNYLFVRVDLERKVEVLRTAGVCWFVGKAGAPSSISPPEIELLRKLVENPAHLQPHPFLDRGDQVRVIRGPFAGLTGTLLRVKNQHRVVVSIELLRKSAAVEVDIASLERISQIRHAIPSQAKVSVGH